jgi:ECF transporter S component (folate family)
MSKLKNVKVLTTVAMLLAMATVLGFFKLPLTNLVEIRFGFIPVAIGGALFGPAVGGVLGGLADVLGYLAKPTGAFFPGFTISSIVGGIIFGLVLHSGKGLHGDNKSAVIRIFIAELVYTIVVGLLMNSYNLSLLYGTPFVVTVSTRILKELVMLPINTAILSVCLIPSHKMARHVLKTNE